MRVVNYKEFEDGSAVVAVYQFGKGTVTAELVANEVKVSAPKNKNGTLAANPYMLRTAKEDFEKRIENLPAQWMNMHKDMYK